MEATIDDSDSFQGFGQTFFFFCSWVGPIGDTVGTTDRREGLWQGQLADVSKSSENAKIYKSV